MSTLKFTIPFPSGHKIEITQGDITREHIDAIVNAANSHLAHGGGVAGAILRAGGSIIQEESDAWVRQNGPVTHDRPAYTRAGKLPCLFVIHAVGPIWGEGEEDRKLTEAVQGSLSLAERLGMQSLAMPAISTGIFGFPQDRAARIILAALRDYYTRNPASVVKLARLVLWDEETVSVFAAEAQRQ
jgi:O-acetyl-ADP-ribose deacetylase